MAENQEKDIQDLQEEAAVTEETAETCEETAAEETAETPEQEEVAEDPAADDTSEGSEKKEKKSFFKKKKDPKDEKIAELTDLYQRLFAEFDNYRKRTDKEKEASFELGASSAWEKILPVVDNLERGLASIPEAEKETPVAAGMDKIYRQLMKTLADAGVESMNAEGSEFDPNLHNAVMQVENQDLEEGTVAAELQKGYTYKGRVLRHAMVSVVQ